MWIWDMSYIDKAMRLSSESYYQLDPPHHAGSLSLPHHETTLSERPVPEMTEQSGSSHFQELFESALQAYEKKTGITLSRHPLAMKLQSCDSVEGITTLLQGQAKSFKKSDKIIRSMETIVSILTPLSFAASLPDTVGLTFPPAKAIQACIGVLLDTAKGVVAGRDALVGLLESIGHFVGRLKIYTEIPLSSAMVEIVVQIMVELISILAMETEKFTRRRLIKSIKKLWGDNEGDKDIEAALQKLDRLTQYEHLNAAAQTLGVVSEVKASVDGVREDLKILPQIASDMNKSKREKVLSDLRNWLSPLNPRKNHNTALELRHGKTGAWFVKGNTLSAWKASGPSSLLWIHGKPGAGKTILCSTIIEEIEKLEHVSLAIFYYDFRENKKQDLHGMLSSVLVQLCCQSDSYCDILSKLRSEHDDGSEYPSDGALIRCLKHLLELPGQDPIFLIVDALGESPNTPELSPPREKVLVLLKDLIDLKLPNLRICVTSRPEIDIKAILMPLTFYSISLHDEHGQNEDIKDYIRSAVSTNEKMKKWSTEHKQLVIDVLSGRADGIFRLVACQLEYLAGCYPAHLQHALDGLPATLDGIYERILGDIEDTKWEDVRRLLQCVAVASRPLRVEELADIFAFDFDVGPIPKFYEERRLEHLVQGVLSRCPTIFSLVNVKNSQVIQFAHLSVQELLTSTYFTEKCDVSSNRYHISMPPAHTVVAQACLGILLHLDKTITRNNLTQYPLAEYAAKYWFEHARFEGVSQIVDEGIQQLFDPRKPHLAVWLWICDPTVPPQKQTERAEKPSPPLGTPLHYAAFCGLHIAIKESPIKHSRDINSRGLNEESTPLHLASQEGHLGVVRSLVEQGADAEALDKDGWTPLHWASHYGHVEVAKFLVEHGANVATQDMKGCAPLHRAAANGHVNSARFLIEHGADVSALDFDEYTPLHWATKDCYVDLARLLVGKGANPSTPDKDGLTPLHWVSRYGHVDFVRFLVEHGVDVAAQDKKGCAPLHRASENGHLDCARLLIEHGADVSALDFLEYTPLHWATKYCYIDLAQLLVEKGADPSASDKNGWTPLHWVSYYGHVDFARFLVEHDVNVAVQDKKGCTPLHRASDSGHVDCAQFLVEHGANVSSLDYSGYSPLHWTTKYCHVNLALFLVGKGADPAAMDKNGWTPLHWVSHYGHVDFIQFFVEHGVDVEIRDKKGRTPLHLASASGRVDSARFLVENGANLSALDISGYTPLHWATSNSYVDIARLLVEKGADLSVPDKDGWTPLHWVSHYGHVDFVLFLVDHGVDVKTRDKQGRTSLDCALAKGHVNVARFLIEHGAIATAQAMLQIQGATT